MANHKSALKRIRRNNAKRLHNRYYAKTTRNAIRDFRVLTSKKEAEERLPSLYEMIDKLAKKNIIHKNKAGNLKSSLSRQLAAMS
jgi:small subunit ribosomal protein S20